MCDTNMNFNRLISWCNSFQLGSLADWVGIIFSLVSIMIVCFQTKKQINNEIKLNKEKARPVFSLGYWTVENVVQPEIRSFFSEFNNLYATEVRINLRKHIYNHGNVLEIYNPSMVPILFVKLKIRYKLKISGIQDETFYICRIVNYFPGNNRISIQDETFYIGRIEPSERINCIPIQFAFPDINISDFKKLTKEQKVYVHDKEVIVSPSVVHNITLWYTTSENEHLKCEFVEDNNLGCLRLINSKEIKLDSKDYSPQGFYESDSKIWKMKDLNDFFIDEKLDEINSKKGIYPRFNKK